MTARLQSIGLSLLLVAGLGACDKPGPAETAGKNLDDTLEKTGQRIEAAGDKIQDTAKGNSD